MYMCPISNAFRDRAISQHSSKIVNKKDIFIFYLEWPITMTSQNIGLSSWDIQYNLGIHKLSNSGVDPEEYHALTYGGT
jgi:hypothetical protein